MKSIYKKFYYNVIRKKGESGMLILLRFPFFGSVVATDWGLSFHYKNGCFTKAKIIHQWNEQLLTD